MLQGHPLRLLAPPPFPPSRWPVLSVLPMSRAGSLHLSALPSSEPLPPPLLASLPEPSSRHSHSPGPLVLPHQSWSSSHQAPRKQEPGPPGCLCSLPYTHVTRVLSDDKIQCFVRSFTEE